MIDSNFTLIELSDKGAGVFSNKGYTPNEVLGEYIQNTPTKIGRKLTDNLWETNLLGRYCNHSGQPSGYLVEIETGYVLCASNYIDIGDEITVNYYAVESKLGLTVGTFARSSFIKRDYKQYGKVICEY